jgi:hypothetical protein
MLRVPAITLADALMVLQRGQELVPQEGVCRTGDAVPVGGRDIVDSAVFIRFCA